jgi:hypothetical protein
MTGPGPILPYGYLPEPVPAANWPDAVLWSGSPGFQRSARAWLFDLAPARCRYETVLHRCTVELARLVRLRLEADVVAMHARLQALESEQEPADGEFVELVDFYRRECDWTVDMLEQVKLVECGLTAGLTDGRTDGNDHFAAHHLSPGGRSWIACLPAPRHATG